MPQTSGPHIPITVMDKPDFKAWLLVPADDIPGMLDALYTRGKINAYVDLLNMALDAMGK